MPIAETPGLLEASVEREADMPYTVVREAKSGSSAAPVLPCVCCELEV